MGAARAHGVDRHDRATAFLCAAVALFVAAGAAVLAMGPERDVTRLVRIGENEAVAQIARATDPDFRFVHDQARYDGVYFYTIARDPFATGSEHTVIDAPAYRYGHPGYGWVSGLLALGRAPLVPVGMLLTGLLGIALASYFTALIAASYGWTPWFGLLIVANPGAIYSLISLTSETLALALLAGAVLAWIRARHLTAAIAFTALALVKEPFVLLPLALLGWELLQPPARRPPLARLAPLLLPAAALGGWFLYLRARFGVWSFTDGPENLTLPFAGWVDSLQRAAESSFTHFEAAQLGSASFPLLVSVAVLFLAGAVRALRLRSPFDAMFLGQVAVIACVSWLVLLYPKDMLRNIAIPLALLPAVLAGPRLRSEDEVPADEQDRERAETGGRDGHDEVVRARPLDEAP